MIKTGLAECQQAKKNLVSCLNIMDKARQLKHFNSCCWMSNKAGALWLQFDNWADTGPPLFWSFSGSFYLLTITSAWVVVTVLTAWWDSNPCFLQWERDDVVCSAGPTLRWELANNICNDGPFANIQPSEWETQLGNNLLGFLNRFIISISSSLHWLQTSDKKQMAIKV